MHKYNHWIYKEGTSSYGVFQLIGLEAAPKPDNGPEDVIEINLDTEKIRKKNGCVNVVILNKAGEQVRTIGASLKTGKATWDLRNNTGDMCPMGVYVAVIEARGDDGYIQRKKTKLAIDRYCN